MKRAAIVCLLGACSTQYLATVGPQGGDDALSPIADLGNSAGNDAATGMDAGTGTDAGGCGPCNTPPDDCHARIGTCSASGCVYAFVDGATCDDGDPCTVGDSCSSGVCAGVAMGCDTPPASVCLSNTQAKTYDHVGSCQGGLCVYPSHTASCASGCTGGSCEGDACAGITCDAPPSGCYLATGTCGGGSCSYGFNDGATCNDNNLCTSNDQCNSGTCKGVPRSCNSPPANSCDNATTLRVYGSIGTCAAATGNCSYSYGFVSCANGCAAGVCNSSGWQVMNSNTTNDLFSVWGASASSVWAVGHAGTMVFYNGAQWQVRTIPPEALNEDLYVIHGTSASNVFLVAGTTLERFDGSKWTAVVNLNKVANFGYVTGIYATGDASNDVYVSMMDYANAVPSPTLYVVDNTGKITLLGGNADPQGSECFANSGSVWEFSPTNVLFSGCHVRKWNGSSVGDLGGTTFIAAERLWAASPTAVFAVGEQANWGGSGTISMWDGASWTTTPIAINGVVYSLWGTAANRVFFSGWDSSKNLAAVLYYDGLGFTNLKLPAGVTSALDGIWAAPTGEVFAVGSGGTILQGP